MAVESSILPEADQEIADAYHWLERRGSGLGKEFLRCLEAALATICQMPEGFAKIMDEFTGGAVVVYAVFHGAQDPEKLRRSLWLRKPE